MDRNYWERVARDYDDEIFDSLASDREGTMLRHLDRLAVPSGRAFDVGCGVGKYVPALARRFRAVEAVDLSAECIRRAKAAYGHLKNVSFRRGDLSRATRVHGTADFALCTNVLIMPSLAMRAGILRRLAGALRAGGGLMVLVPSLESALYVHARRAEWMRRAPGTRVPAPTTLFGASGASGASGAPGRDVLGGILAIDGVRTKHWLREELAVALDGAGFAVGAVDKVTFDWKTEFHKPPRWLKSPRPWGWVAVARRR